MSHMLYPDVEAWKIVPFGICSSLYDLPEAPTTGVERGSTVSSEAWRVISGKGLCKRRVSYAIHSVRAFALCADCEAANLDHGVQIRHVLKFNSSKVFISFC